jgi:hypothetical protein
MDSASFETTVAAGTAEALERIVANVEELSANDVHTALLVCDFIQTLFKTARASIESALRQGVDAKAFAAKYERAVVTLDTVKDAVGRVLAKVKGSRLPALGGELISRYEDLDTDLTSLRQFLLEAIAEAKKPSRPIDWQHVREVEEAYPRGETKPLRKIAGARNGS